MGNYQLLRQCRIDVQINDTVLQLSSYGRDDLKIPGTQLYMVQHLTFDAIVKASGLQMYDYAFPVDWIRHEYWSKGLDTPRGVWSYDDNRTFGSFVSLDHMLERIGVHLQQIGLTSIYAMA